MLCWTNAAAFVPDYKLHVAIFYLTNRFHLVLCVHSDNVIHIYTCYLEQHSFTLIMRGQVESMVRTKKHCFILRDSGM